MHTVIVTDEGDAFADIQPDRQPWATQVVAILAAQRTGMRWRWTRVGDWLGVAPDHAERMLAGDLPITVTQVEKLAAAMGIRFDPPTTQPIA